MKKKIIFAIGLFLLGFVPLSGAGEIMTGMVVKLEKSFVTIELVSGDHLRVHFDGRTRVEGKLRESAVVDLEEEEGHANWILVFEEEESNPEVEDEGPSNPAESEGEDPS